MHRALIFAAVVLAVAAAAQRQKKNRTAPTGYSDTPVIPGQKWKVHDIDRPKPRVVAPGASHGQPPADAIVLFDGKNLDAWTFRGPRNLKAGETAGTWKVEDGSFYSTGNSGTLISKEKFGDAQFHVEWASPGDIDGTSQWRGNSGIVLMNRYEIQVLDSWNNPTYADGQAAAIYGWWPPMVNVSRRPGEWQIYDIVFEAPKFDGDKIVKPPRVTVIHNGVVVHHNQEIGGPMAHRVVLPFKPHAAEEPLGLQDHDTETRYRNIWARKLKGYDAP